MTVPLRTDVIIVGGGLAGLALADRLQRAGVDFQLFEARSRFGGRIRTDTVTAGGRVGAFDLGPAWYWPGQPRMRGLVDRLDLDVFDQYATGLFSFEDETGAVARGRDHASMEGSYRIKGGLTRLIDGLAATLDKHRLHVGTPIHALHHHDRIDALDDGGNTVVNGERVVLALPPRIAERLRFDPALPDQTSRALRDIRTWMAGQAKIVAVYDQPFWRDEGLSGDAMSRVGPMVEIHDASDPTTDMGALFGFVGVPAAARHGQGEALKAAAREQLGRVFGQEALYPLQVLLQDWAFDAETATEDDLAPMDGHPIYGLTTSSRDLWDGRLMLGSSEVAQEFGGYLEGALEAADQVMRQLVSETSRRTVADR